MLSFRRKAEVFAICCTRCKFGSQSASHLERTKEKEGEWYTTNHQNEHIIQSTERWVRDFVVRRNLCPFASKYRRSIHVINLKNDASNVDCKAHIKDHILHLIADDQLKVSTKLLVFPQERLSEWIEFEKLADSVQDFCGTDGELFRFTRKLAVGLVQHSYFRKKRLFILLCEALIQPFICSKLSM